MAATTVMMMMLVAIAAGLTEVAAGPFSSLGGGVVMSRVRRSSAPGDRETCGAGQVAPPTRVDTAARVTALRDEMATKNIQAYIIPMDDEHQSEYVSDHDKRVTFISGFEGSAGFAIVTTTDQALWTDGRYFVQAEAELDCNWKLMRQGVDAPAIATWLEETLADGDKVGADSKVYSHDKWVNLDEGLTMQTLEDHQGLLDAVWDTKGEELNAKRPPMPDNDVEIHPKEYSGADWDEKVARVRGVMTGNEVDTLVVTALDETAWLFSMRGSDVAYNPVFFSYALVQDDSVRLYLYNKATHLAEESLRVYLKVDTDGTCVTRQACVQVKDYSDFFSDLSAASVDGQKVWVSPTSSYAVYNALGTTPAERSARAFKRSSAIRTMKGRKNPTEVNGMRTCHVRDSAVVVEFAAMLEKEVQDGETWTELSASTKLAEMRGDALHNKGLSFATISASGANGAIIHYRPTENTDTAITTSDMYLLDSGGQYLDGTTDVTRTFHFGEPKPFEKEAYTRVLMGAIDLAMTIWPNGTYGRDIDAIARSPLWRAGLDYRHGTGHGLGAYLNVHEGPGRISLGYRETAYEEPLYGEMFFSDEPGYYEDGAFGVRLETIVMTTPMETEYRFGDKDYLGFEHFTLVPFESNLIDYTLLTTAQRNWLNTYHALCEEKVGKFLKDADKDEAYEWLIKRTRKIADTPTYTGAAQRTACGKGLALVVIATVLHLAL